MRPSWVTLLLQTVNFAILVALLYRFLWRPVLALLDRRRQEVDRDLHQAAAARREAQALQAELAEQRATLARERDEALAAAHAQAEAARAALLARAQAEADAGRAEAQARLAGEREEAARELVARAGAVAVEAAARLLSDVGPPPPAPFLDRAVACLRALPPGRRRGLGRAAAHGGVLVRTAAVLGEPERRRCAAELGEALGGPVGLAFEVDPALLGGLELHFPGEVLRCSWREALDRAHEGMIRDGQAPRRAG